MEAKVLWKENLAFDGVVNSGLHLKLDSPAAAGELLDGYSPMELVLVGLAGCTAMDVISILQKKRQEVTQFEVRAEAQRSEEHPRVFTAAVVEYVISGVNIDRAAVERAVELSVNKYCSVQAMLVKAFPVEHKIIIQEA